jgi:putative tryptophan/tyrosine transport system substrate-binding protein
VTQSGHDYFSDQNSDESVYSAGRLVVGMTMRRRTFVAGLAGTIAFPFSMFAQTRNHVYRLGHLSPTSEAEEFTRQITLPELAKLGFVEGRNLIFDGRVGEPRLLPTLMSELLAGQPDAVVVIGPALKAASTATQSVPVVAFGSEFIEAGLAKSYARPGGNVTGVVILAGELEAKRLSILVEAIPNRRRIAALISSQGETSEEALRKAAADLGVELLLFVVAGPNEYTDAFAAMRAQGAEALIIAANPQFQRDGQRLAGLAIEGRLPLVCEWAEMARDGCLIGYGPNRIELRKRLANQIAQVFRGVAPGDIPIERPTTFELGLNLKTAKALELDISPAFLTRADQVIE